jgi:hypothetical protein
MMLVMQLLCFSRVNISFINRREWFVLYFVVPVNAKLSPVATLTGSVGSWIGWNEADKDAHKSGATEVLNRVTIKKGFWFW